ncbi:MAG: hypothetical protein QOF78_1442 [Phycisphaerales bacterium]|jgi:hypothetical protein|nr:hypothetical protein [Phycisphaerales bacterium]
MAFVRLILVLAIGASAMGANRMPAAQKADEHSCCKPKDASQEKEKKRDCGTCLMTCCRIVSAPADPVTTPIDESPVAVRIVIPPALADDLGEPQAIFHPPRG